MKIFESPQISIREDGDGSDGDDDDVCTESVVDL